MTTDARWCFAGWVDGRWGGDLRHPQLAALAGAKKIPLICSGEMKSDCKKSEKNKVHDD